jgi:twitching motility protein PilU
MDTNDWNAALKNAMRQAPDCILIGEIRDKETMQAAIAYAQTGHLCLATLHANNSYHALNRIISFFPLENRAGCCSSTSRLLRAIVSQRLVKKPDGKRSRPAKSCSTPATSAELIERGEVQASRKRWSRALAPGSQTFEQDLFRLYREVITLDEALANADSPTNLSWLINNSEIQPPSRQASAEKRSIPALNSTAPIARRPSFKEFSLSLDPTTEGENVLGH